MSIPGLGQIASAAVPLTSSGSPATSTTTTHHLQPFWEWRFDVPVGLSVDVRLVAGTAEKDGTELAPGATYTFTGAKSKINTWQGCSLEVTTPPSTGGSVDAYVSEPTADDTPLVSYLNLHMKLEALRTAAEKAGQMGPRVLIAGPGTAGKTSLVKMLTGWATRMGRSPMAVNTDPSEGMLSLPGTLSAAVFATIMDPTTEWGGTPSSGPVAFPVKLPLAYYYGLAHPEDNAKLFKSLLSRLAVASTSRLAEDPQVKSSGMVIDTAGVNTSGPGGGKAGYETLVHIASELSVNIVIVLGSERIYSELARVLADHKTTLGEHISVVNLDKSGGVVERDQTFAQQSREASIKEYFFGDSKRTLSPFTQTVDFSGLTIFKMQEAQSGEEDYYGANTVEKVEPSVMMLNCTLAVMYASVHDPAETIRDSNVMGFVYVADVDEKKKKVKILTPVSARLGDRPLLWGSWPEPSIGLLG